MLRPIPLAVARERLLAEVPPDTMREVAVGLGRALGRVLARPAHAGADLPPFDRSLVDGFAVATADGPWHLAGHVAMGVSAPVLPARGALGVPTGGMLPEGTVAVVMQEDALVQDGILRVQGAVRVGQNLVRRGADARAGAVVLPDGRRLRPADIAMLATVGVVRVRVRRRPRIAILSTGDELVGAGARAGPGQVPDSNGPALAAALERDGAVPVPLGIVADARPALRAAVGRGAAADALICTGGSSVGERDLVPAVLREVYGVEPLFWGLALRPGRPTAAFTAGGRWAVALPGHAVSALVVYELLVRPAVRRFAGETEIGEDPCWHVTLAAPVRAPADRDLYVRVRVREGRAWPLPGPSALIGDLSGADALVLCRAGMALDPGTAVAALPLG